jgi:hypothetical protein
VRNVLGQDPGSLAFLQVVGLRELIVAVAFMRQQTSGWPWGFVIQDALDRPLSWWVPSSRHAPDRSRFRRASS